MEGWKLQQLNRNFFDPVAKHELDVLMCAEIAHKVLRTDTIYNILTQLVKVSSDYQNAFKAEVIGMVVITDYNNKTYRVSDIDFGMSPKSTFKRKEKDVTFVDYYKRRYNLTIRDFNQPLLISKPTEKNTRGGQDDLIILVPELTGATGLNYTMRGDWI
ncbi:protein aubergine-like [Teleopsis dalmanni]|uniref:protein aubergine-like n=1 Tax=Teleopsis dalmanni TaxID=139649 RepID=UPI0018CE10D5|nr:protein aubergine-like [Teleopsis dalmanni]XP_037958452.1 protein aubergine-like [Teleopsis dalmanni]XP_037961050.1 protein aubergine-like [Teleopsis dalmanni]